MILMHMIIRNIQGRQYEVIFYMAYNLVDSKDVLMLPKLNSFLKCVEGTYNIIVSDGEMEFTCSETELGNFKDTELSLLCNK